MGHTNINSVKHLKSKTKTIVTGLVASISAAVVALAFGLAPVLASSSVIYNNIPSPTPGNVVSLAFQSTQTSEFGGQVQFAGTNRYNPVVTVLMSSWGCQTGGWSTADCVTAPGSTFSEPITLNIYNVNVNNSPGTLVATLTQTFNIAYRPSTDSLNCTGGRWYDAINSTCYNGLAVPISFDFTGQNVTLPNKVIISAAYNTSGFGALPYGYATACAATTAGCGYDSLNVGTNPAPSVGSALPSINDAYLNSITAGNYCAPELGTGTFRLDAGCWTGYLPAFKVSASPTKDQCKNDGWKQFNNPSFKNQGQCIDWIKG